MIYNILKPIYEPHYEYGERVRIDHAAAWKVSWKVIGQCNGIAHAKELGFICPVLEELK